MGIVRKDFLVVITTKMKGTRICSIVVDPGTSILHRVLFGGGKYVSKDFLKNISNGDKWVPGVFFKLDFWGKNNPRITHPEDSYFSSDNWEYVGMAEPEKVKNYLEQHFLKNSMEEIFGQPVIFQYGKPVLPDNCQLNASVGIVKPDRVGYYMNSFGKLRCEICMGTDKYDVPVVSLTELQNYQSGLIKVNQVYKPDLVLMGLTDPYRPDAWPEDKKFCFLQLEGVIY